MSKVERYEWIGFGYRRTHTRKGGDIEIFIASEEEKSAIDIARLDKMAMEFLKKWPKLCENFIVNVKKHLKALNRKLEITPAMVKVLSLSLYVTGDADYDHVKYLLEVSNDEGNLLNSDNLELMQVVQSGRVRIEPVYDE
jgi:hypothetical protein